MPKQPVVFKTKLGAAKKVERSRIWIEGQRLIDAGFTVGKYFAKDWTVVRNDNDQIIGASLEITLLKPNDVLATAPCKVSGKDEKPIIDITGEKVRETFGVLGTHVECTFTKGKIVIRPAVDNG